MADMGMDMSGMEGMDMPGMAKPGAKTPDMGMTGHSQKRVPCVRWRSAVIRKLHGLSLVTTRKSMLSS